jgi:hypothetical protein
MTSEKTLLEAHLYSWGKLTDVLGDLGKPPYIKFSDEPVILPDKTLPRRLGIIFSENYISSEYDLLVRGGDEFNLIKYYICGTHVPPKSYSISSEEKLVEDVIKVNTLNAFSQVNPQFLSFFNAYRSHRDHRKRIAVILDPYVTGVPDYFYLTLKDQLTLKERIKKDDFYKAMARVGLKNSMKDPWKTLRDVAWLQEEPKLAAALCDLEDMNKKFAENLVQVMKLDIDQNWIKLL